MFKVKIITVGKSKEKWLGDAIREYEKRLVGKMELDWLLFKDDAEMEHWAKENTYVALDPNGKLLTSEAWSKKMVQFGLRVNFLIGSATGLSQKILEKAAFIWSLSPLTFTHQMTRLILVEQIYRALEIERGSKYHK